MKKATSPYIVGLIPARAGSKGIPNKNWRKLAGKPLIQYTFDAAKSSRYLKRILLTTDSEAVATIARQNEIEVPFMRPPALANDTAPMRDVIAHAIQWLRDNATAPDIVVLLQPTAPLRQAVDIDNALNLLLKHSCDSVVSVAPIEKHFNPHWQFKIVEDQLTVFTGEPLGELVSRRQDLPETYTRNGAIYAFFTKTFDTYGTIYGERCLPYCMTTDRSINIDNIEDWHKAEQFLSQL